MPRVGARLDASNPDETPTSVNDWPEGRRELLCLACDRRFESISKVQRLCDACRPGG